MCSPLQAGDEAGFELVVDDDKLRGIVGNGQLVVREVADERLADEQVPTAMDSAQAFLRSS